MPWKAVIQTNKLITHGILYAAASYWLRACIHVCTCGSGFFFYFLPLVMHYVTLLFKFKVIHLALRNKQLFTCSRISILFCLPELNTPGKVKAAGHAPSGVPLAPALHLCHGLPMLSPLQIPSRKQTNASPLTYKSVSTKVSVCLQK